MRLFLAFTLTNSSIDKIIDIQKNIDNLGLSLIKRENIHITLFFFGDTEDKKIIDIIEIIKQIKFEKIELELKRFIYLPNLKRPSVLALEIESNNFLDKIVNNFNNLLNNLEYKRDKIFLPHISIARVKKYIPIIKYEENIKITIDNIKLFKSELMPKGAIYSELFSYE